MRILFLVQGEGRGHLTQAISLAQILQSAGHEVVEAIVDVAESRPVPTFFREQFPGPITVVDGPALVYSSKTNALKPYQTFLRNSRHYPKIRKSFGLIRDSIDRQKPDVIVNFFQLLGGLTYALYRPNVPMICIAHQYLSFHPDFPFPKGNFFDRQIFNLITRLNAIGATEVLALSFDQQADVPAQKLRVVPPLLRREVTERTPTSEDYLLAYTTQPGLSRQIEAAHRQRPDVPIHCFHSGVTEPDQSVDETLTYHKIDGKRYLDIMQHCRAIVTTAGFESVCEAMYWGKPALLIPQPNHFEQACNALDAQRVGAGVAADKFDLNLLMNYLPNHDPQVNERFRQWYGQGYYLFLNTINRVSAEAKKSSASRFSWSALTRRLRLH